MVMSRDKLKKRCKDEKISAEGNKGAMVDRIVAKMYSDAPKVEAEEKAKTEDDKVESLEEDQTADKVENDEPSENVENEEEEKENDDEAKQLDEPANETEDAKP